MAEDGQDRSVTVEQYHALYGDTPTGKWVLRDGEDIEWWTAEAIQKVPLGDGDPHVRDPYWVAVAYGAYEAAKELGARLDLRPAGGYLKLSVMMADIEDLIAPRRRRTGDIGGRLLCCGRAGQEGVERGDPDNECLDPNCL